MNNYSAIFQRYVVSIDLISNFLPMVWYFLKQHILIVNDSTPNTLKEA
jgi:hypothetical protein